MAIQRDEDVFLVDDSQSVRERLKELLEVQGGMRVVGESGTAASAVHDIPRAQPDFVVLDYELPDGTGLDVLHEVHDLVPRTRFIVLTNHASTALRTAFAAAGAWYLLDKSYEFARLVDLIVDRPSPVDPASNEET